MATNYFNQQEPIILDEEQMAQTIEAAPPLFFGNEQTPEQNQFIDNVLALPRGFGKSAARMVAAEIPEGLWALTDLATNLTGFEDALDPKESAFLDRLQEVRDKIGYEESVPGRLGEALGSMAAFVGTSLLTGGAAGALSGAGKAAQAAKLFQTGKLIKAAKASPATFAFMSSPGYMFAAGEQQLRMKARERAGEDIEIGDRNLALALAIPVGISEFIPIGRIFGGMKRADVPAEEFFRYQEILKRGFRNAGEEGLQEAGAGIMQDLIERGIYNPDAAIGETWASEFGYGAGAGGLFSLALNIANRKADAYKRTQTENNPDGDPDVLIKDSSPEVLAEVAKQHGLDIPAPDQSEADVLNSELENLESEFEKNIGLETTTPLPEINTADAVIPPDVQAGDTLDIFDIKGTPIAAQVSAISDAGTIKIITPDGNEEILDNSFYMTRNVKNPNYLLVAPNLPSRVQGRTIKDLSDEELPTVLSELEERLARFKSENINPQSGAYTATLSDYNAAKHEVERRKKLGIDVLGEVLKSFDDGEEKAKAFETEKLTEVAEEPLLLKMLTKQ